MSAVVNGIHQPLSGDRRSKQLSSCMLIPGFRCCLYMQQHAGGTSTNAEDEGAAVAGLLEQHGALRSILGARLSHLQVVGGFWARGDLRGACAALQRASGERLRGHAMSLGHRSRQAAARIEQGAGTRRCSPAAALERDMGNTLSAAASAGCQASPRSLQTG